MQNSHLSYSEGVALYGTVYYVDCLHLLALAGSLELEQVWVGWNLKVRCAKSALAGWQVLGWAWAGGNPEAALVEQLE